MKVECSMTEEQKFEVNRWYAHCPEFVIGALHAQLIAAQAVWPELVNYVII